MASMGLVASRLIIMKRILALLFIILFSLSCERGWLREIADDDYYGCTDESACNFNELSYEDDGNCSYEQDCKGVCGGTAKVDCNGECDGDAILDCSGICNGNATIDSCGTCDSNPSNDCEQDCFGVWGGTAEIDACGICGGNATDGTDCST